MKETDSMNKADRQALIRRLYLSKAKGMAFVARGAATTPAPIAPKPDRIVMGWPQIIPDTKRAPRWMRERDAKPVPVVRPLRKERVSPLTKIAEKWDARRGKQIL